MQKHAGLARVIWLFREKLTTAGAIKRLFEQFDAMLRAIYRRIGRPSRPSCGARIATRAGTIKFTKANPREDGSTPPVDPAIPLFGYQNHISIDRRFGFIRRWAAKDAAAYEGRRLRQGLLDSSNTASGVWADTAYRSAANETFLNKNGFVSHIATSIARSRKAALCPRQCGGPISSTTSIFLRNIAVA
jgi:IS5 family transposase